MTGVLTPAAEIARLDRSGWQRLPGVRARLPVAPADDLAARDPGWWERTDAVASELRVWLRGRRFAESVDLGLLSCPRRSSWTPAAPSTSISAGRRTRTSAPMSSTRGSASA